MSKPTPYSKPRLSMSRLIIPAVFVMVSVAIVYSFAANNRGFTEARAYDNVGTFIAKNNIKTKRMTCAGDSDGDGYGTCTIAATDDEVMTLECPTDWLDVNVWRATSCKEIPMLRMQGFGHAKR